MLVWHIALKTWHIEDLRDDMNIPGLIIYMMGDDIRVRFTDRTFDEVHVPGDSYVVS
jgi:hypothetical protein